MRKSILSLMSAFVLMLLLCCGGNVSKTKTMDELVDEAGSLFEDSTLTSLSHEQLCDMMCMVDSFLFWREHEDSEESMQYYRQMTGYIADLLLRCKVDPADAPLVEEMVYRMEDLNFRFNLVGEDDSMLVLEHVGHFAPKGYNPYGDEVAVAFEFNKQTGLCTHAFCTLPDIFPSDKAPDVAFAFSGGVEKNNNIEEVLTFSRTQYVDELGWMYVADSVNTKWLRDYVHFYVLCRGEEGVEFDYLVNLRIFQEQYAEMFGKLSKP